MVFHRAFRPALALVAVIALVVPASAALAEDPPPPNWVASGPPIVADDYRVVFETAELDTGGFGLTRELRAPSPAIRPVFTNLSAAPVRVGLGLDFFEQGVLNPLFSMETWNRFGFDIGSTDGLFSYEVAPGEELVMFDGGGPRYAGRTLGVYLIDQAGTPEDETDDSFELIAEHSEPGRFVPVYTDGDQFDFGFDVNLGIGRPVVVAGSGQELFPGVEATVTSQGLVAGEQLEMWLAPEFDYFYFMLTGGVLPVDAFHVGDAVVASDGTLSATFSVPLDAETRNDYQLVVGVPGERYWPAGSYRNFEIAAPTNEGSASVDAGGGETSIDLSVGQVSLTFPAGTTAGEVSAVASATGPLPSGFILWGSTPVFFHLSSTATFDAPVEVCLEYDAASFPAGQVPRLYHHGYSGGAYSWADITSSREPGRVCGLTSTFSPFVLGFPLVEEPVHDGSTAPPAKGVISHDNGWDTGLLDGDYTVSMNLWWGENASEVRLYEGSDADRVLVGTAALTRATPSAQKATFAVSGKPNGQYRYTAVLSNSTGETATSAITVKVTDANPGKPALSDDNWDKNGSYVVTADMWWGTNATSYTFRENGVVVGSGSLTAQTPKAQKATLSVSGRPKGSYVYTVTFTNAAGETVSSSRTVKVTK